MHLSSHPRPSIPPPACRHPHALFSAPAGLPRGKPKNPLRSSSICYNPHTHPPYQPAKHPSPASPSCPGPRACLPQPPTFSPCRPPCAPAAALQHPLLPAPHPATEHQHQHHWKPHPAPSTYCPPEPPGESPPGHRPAAQPTAPTLRSPPHLAPAPVPKTPTPPRCLSFSYPGVNRQALHHLLTSATAPAAPPPHLHLLASGHRPLPSPPAPARSPVATHLFVLSALAGDVSFQFIPPLRSVLPTFRQAGKLESWKVGKHTTRAVREDPSHRQPTAGARARPPASPHSPSIHPRSPSIHPRSPSIHPRSPSIHPRSPVTYRSSSSHPRLRLTRRVNRQTLRPLLTSATHPCPARAPGESSTCPRSPAPPSSPLHPAPGPSPGAKSSRPPAHCRHPRSPLHLAPAHLGQPASKPGPRSGASPLCCFGSPAPLAAFAARADPSVRRRTWRRPLPSTSTRGEQYLPAGRRHPRSPPSPAPAVLPRGKQTPHHRNAAKPPTLQHLLPPAPALALPRGKSPPPLLPSHLCYHPCLRSPSHPRSPPSPRR